MNETYETEVKAVELKDARWHSEPPRVQVTLATGETWTCEAAEAPMPGSRYKVTHSAVPILEDPLPFVTPEDREEARQVCAELGRS